MQPGPEPEPEAYQEPDITPDFLADANDMYPGYQQAETDPGAEWLAAHQAHAAQPRPDPEPEPEVQAEADL